MICLHILDTRHFDQDALDEVEELLYGADLGPKMVDELTMELTEVAKKGDITQQDIKELLYNFLKNKIAAIQAEVETAAEVFQAFSGPRPGAFQSLRVFQSSLLS